MVRPSALKFCSRTNADYTAYTIPLELKGSGGQFGRWSGGGTRVEDRHSAKRVQHPSDRYPEHFNLLEIIRPQSPFATRPGRDAMTALKQLER
jgi:hypothetical protein